eukprot:GHVS01063993.1.p3 GENE.GHVS01063993.1~~GHVS01063993.1.p3  ORF type:complete len:102 (+),score=10.46 GHVS01063993.1:311-616(+)
MRFLLPFAPQLSVKMMREYEGSNKVYETVTKELYAELLRDPELLEYQRKMDGTAHVAIVRQGGQKGLSSRGRGGYTQVGRGPMEVIRLEEGETMVEDVEEE